MEAYFPNNVLPQTALEEADGCAGKYTVGLGQESLAFFDDREDVASVLLSALVRLLEGYGVTTRLAFTPSLIELGPILPYSDEGMTGQVTMTNASDRPVEIYSLDFDKQFNPPVMTCQVMNSRGGKAPQL